MKISLTNFLGGVNSNISPLLQPPNSLPVGAGVNGSYELGALRKDTGYLIVSTTLETGKSVLGLHDSKQTPAVHNIYATVNDSGDNDTQLFYKTLAGAWDEIPAAETNWGGKADINTEMETFIGYEFIVGHGDTDGFLPPGSVTNITFSPTVNVTSMPGAKYIKRYRDRLYIANCDISGTGYPYRVYFSSVPVAGAITWTVADDFLDVGYGEQIMGMGSNWDRLVVFTEDQAYFYDQSSFKQTWATGCANHRTIKNYGPFMFWADSDGLWVSGGGQPENVSGPVVDYIRSATPSNFFGEIVDEEYHLYVGSVTVKGIGYSNCSVIFHIPTNTWRVREAADNMTIYGRIRGTSGNYLYMGATDGNIYRKGKYTDATLLNTDNGDDIHANAEFAPMWLGDLSIKKAIAKLTVIADRALGVTINARVIDRNTRALTPYKSIGKLEKYINTFDVNVDRGVFLQLAISEYGSNPYFSILGLELDIEADSEILKEL